MLCYELVKDMEKEVYRKANAFNNMAIVEDDIAQLFEK